MVSGQRAGLTPTRDSRAHVRVWSAASLETLAVLGLGECEVTIGSVAFSSLNRGLYVAAVDGSREKVVSVWDWAAHRQGVGAVYLFN